MCAVYMKTLSWGDSDEGQDASSGDTAGQCYGDQPRSDLNRAPVQ